MSEHENTQERGQRGLLAWLTNRFAGEGLDPEITEVATEPEDGKGIHDPRELRRRQLLDDVSRFLMTHRLEVNSYTLGVAHDVITGSDVRLSRLIEQRVSSRQPVTLDWLEQAGRNSGRNDGSEMLKALMQRLEESLEEFARTTRDAGTATREYQSALEGHVGELEQVGKAGLVISDLAAIARVMLGRTREIEDQMSRSEKRTMALQKNLEEARRSAETDHLTGLPNRRAFEGVLEKTVEEAKAAGEQLCVAFCDIDHFKRVNDTHGHEAGDRVLKAVAQTLARISNDHCHVARHGGEEFVVLFRGKTLVEAHAILDKARDSMAERKLVNRATDMPFGRITFSGGLADVFAHPKPGDALRAADEALYAAKNGGRNQIVVAGEGPPLESVA